MQWFYRLMQIGIAGGTVAFYDAFVFIDEPISLAHVLVIGVFLAILATAVIYWSLEGLKALSGLGRQIQLCIRPKQPNAGRRPNGSKPGRQSRYVVEAPRSDGRAGLVKGAFRQDRR